VHSWIPPFAKNCIAIVVVIASPFVSFLVGSGTTIIIDISILPPSEHSSSKATTTKHYERQHCQSSAHFDYISNNSWS
jgi:hypothetical protein